MTDKLKGRITIPCVIPEVKKAIEPMDERKLLNAGICALMSVDGNDLSPAQAARTSYRDFLDSHTKDSNENLVDYLIRHEHGTPLEFAGATFYMVMPIFVARQMVRHRIVSINEESLRYVAPRDEFYIPDKSECKSQSKVNKQGSSDDLIDEWPLARALVDAQGKEAHRYYKDLVALGLSKELSRTVLPLGQYTAWYWKANLRSIFHLLKLRLDPHAQYQIRVYADAMYDMLKPVFPNTIEAWENHVLNAVTFSADEWSIIKSYLVGGVVCIDDIMYFAKESGMRKTRLDEFKKKLQS